MNRYARQLSLKSIGKEGQALLEKSHIAIVGLGGLGLPAAFALAGAGIGTLSLWDGDTVDETNLHRQLFYRMDQLGQTKTQSCAENLKALNPNIEINTVDKYLQKSDQALLKAVDLVIDGSDNFETKILLDEICAQYGIPLVFGAALGYSGQVSVFHDAQGFSLNDAFPNLDAQTKLASCAEYGVVGMLTSIIGNIQAHEAISLLLDHPNRLSGRMLHYDLDAHRYQILNLKKQAKKEKAVDIEVIPKVSLSDLEQWPQNSFSLIDVRQPDEHQKLNFGGVNIPLRSEDFVNYHPETDKKLVFYCTSGQRSSVAARLVKDKHRSSSVFVLNDLL